MPKLTRDRLMNTISETLRAAFPPALTPSGGPNRLRVTPSGNCAVRVRVNYIVFAFHAVYCVRSKQWALVDMGFDHHDKTFTTPLFPAEPTEKAMRETTLRALRSLVETSTNDRVRATFTVPEAPHAP